MPRAHSRSFSAATQPFARPIHPFAPAAADPSLCRGRSQPSPSPSHSHQAAADPCVDPSLPSISLLHRRQPGVVLRPAAAETKQESSKDDSRGIILILFEKFGFSHRGSVSIALTGARAASKLAKPDSSQLGFFLW